MSKFSKMSIFYVIFLFIFIIAFVHYLRFGTLSDITFTGLLNLLSNAPEFDVSWSLVDLTIYGEWEVFDFFRIFLNWITDIIEVLVFLFGMVIKALNFIIYLARGLFFA